MDVAERIRRTVEATAFVHEGRHIPVTVSLGVAGFTGAEEAPHLVASADRRLYQAKEGGRNRVGGAEEMRIAV